MVVRIKLGEWEADPPRMCTAIEYWYDRSYRHWVLYPVDAEGYQLQEARYAFGKKELSELRHDMENELVGHYIELGSVLG